MKGEELAGWGNTHCGGPGVIPSSLIGCSHPGNWIESLSPNRALREHQEVRKLKASLAAQTVKNLIARWETQF